MDHAQAHIYAFGAFQVDVARRLLLRGGEPLALTPKVFDTLLHLLANSGEVMGKDALMRSIWPDTAVEENNLTQNISTLRRVLGDEGESRRYIATLPGKGYSFVAAVERMAGAANGHGSAVTIAVLPFEDLGTGQGREYLPDGFTEETIASLGQIDPEHFRVIGRTSVMRYRRTTKTAEEIGQELNAQYLVESSLRAEGERLRVTSRLVRVSDGVQIWSASYESEPSSMLTLQRELSIAIAEQIRRRLSPERVTALARRQTQNAEAYELYLQGRHFWNQLTLQTTHKAVEYFTQATQMDGQYALAWAGLVDCYTSTPVHGDAMPMAVWPRAREANARALSAGPELAEVQTALGMLKFWLDWEWPAAEAAYRRAVALDPSYPLGSRMLGICLSHMRRHAEAREAMRRARELDPFYAMHHALSAQVAFAGREFAEAVPFARQATVVNPEFWIAHWQLAQAYAQTGENEEAMKALQSAGRLSGGNTKTISLRGYLLARTGQKDEALEVLRTLKAVERDRYVPPYCIALVHAGLGRWTEALDDLERAFAARDVHMIFLPVDVKWDPVRGERRFDELVRRCGFM